MVRYWRILREHPQPVRFLVAKSLVAARLSRMFRIQRPGYVLRFHPTNLACQFWVDPQLRLDDIRFVLAYVKAGDTVIDVGANIGDLVLAASRSVGEKGHVFAVEPHPRIASYLSDNLRINDISNVQLHVCAAGDCVGEVQFTDSRWDDMNRVGE